MNILKKRRVAKKAILRQKTFRNGASGADFLSPARCWRQKVDFDSTPVWTGLNGEGERVTVKGAKVRDMSELGNDGVKVSKVLIYIAQMISSGGFRLGPGGLRPPKSCPGPPNF